MPYSYSAFLNGLALTSAGAFALFKPDQVADKIWQPLFQVAQPLVIQGVGLLKKVGCPWGNGAAGKLTLGNPTSFESIFVAIFLILLGVAFLHVAVSNKRAAGFSICLSSVGLLLTAYAGHQFSQPLSWVAAFWFAAVFALSLVESLLFGRGGGNNKQKTA